MEPNREEAEFEITKSSQYHLATNIRTIARSSGISGLLQGGFDLLH
jgi:hypothetical protein